jgi:hypothetical protein
MSLFDKITSALGGSEPIERFAAKRAPTGLAVWRS